MSDTINTHVGNYQQAAMDHAFAKRRLTSLETEVEALKVSIKDLARQERETFRALRQAVASMTEPTEPTP